MRSTPLWTRAVRSRPLSLVLLLLLTAVAVATAALGPALVRAAGQSALADAVADADLGQTTVTVTLRLTEGEAYDEPRQQLLVPFGGVDQGPRGTLWAPVTTAITSTTNLDWTPTRQAGAEASSRVNAAETGCAGYVLDAGRCPTAAGEVLVSSRDAAARRVAPDDALSFRLPKVSATELQVVGTYDAIRSLPGQLTLPGTGAGSIAAVTADPLVAAPDQLRELDLPVSVTDTLALRSGVRLDEEQAVRTTLAQVQDLAAQGVSGRVFFYDSVVDTLLDRVDRQSGEASVLIGVAVAQALAVAFFALFIVLQRVGRARGSEWGIGRLRGIERRRWWTSIVTEPALAMVVGLPVGLVLAGAVARLSVAANLRPGTPVEVVRGPVLIAAAAAFLGAVVALVLVAGAAVRRPTVELIQQSAERRRLTPLGAVGQVVVLVAAAAALYQLLSQTRLTAGGSQLGLLAPALLALAVAVVAVRVAVLVVRRVTTRPPRSRTSVVVGRQLGRTPSSLNPAVVIAAALALTVFADQVLALSVRNQDLRGEAVVGAPTVLQVSVPAGRNVRDLVRAADPTGGYAMAVQERAASADSGISRVVGVDSPRFDQVASWSPSWGDGVDVGTDLHPDPLAPVLVRGTKLRITLSDAEVTTRAGIYPSTQQRRVGVYGIAPPVLSATLEAPFAYPDGPVAFGLLQAGTVTYEADIPCQDGCRLAQLALRSQVQQAWSASFTVSAVSTDEQPASTFAARLRTGGWTTRLNDPSLVPQFQQEMTATPTGAGLRVHAVDDQGLQRLSLQPGDAQDPVPTLLGPTVTPAPAPGQDGVVVGTGFDGQPQLLRPIGRASVLPRALDDGLLVDLTDLQGLSDPGEADVIDEVWLAADAPASVETALTAAGVQVETRETVAATQAQLRRQPTTRGAAVAVTVGYAAAALALLTLLASRLADAGRRRQGWRSLREAGLPRSTIRRLAAVEIGVPALLGVVVGVLAGVVATLLAAPRLPLTDTQAPGPPLDLQPAWGPIAVVGLVGIVVVLLVTVLVAGLETRTEGPR